MGDAQGGKAHIGNVADERSRESEAIKIILEFEDVKSRVQNLTFNEDKDVAISLLSDLLRCEEHGLVINQNDRNKLKELVDLREAITTWEKVMDDLSSELMGTDVRLMDLNSNVNALLFELEMLKGKLGDAEKMRDDGLEKQSRVHSKIDLVASQLNDLNIQMRDLEARF